MRVGLLADRLDRDERRTGVGTYIEGIVRGIEEVAPADEFVVFSWGANGGGGGTGVSGARANGSVERRMLGWPRRATVASWMLLGAPKVRDVGGRIDLLHVLVPTVPVPSSAPLVATIHDLMPLKHPQLFRSRQRLLFAETVRRICRRARWLIAVSEATKGDVVDLLGFPSERVTVVHPGVPLHFSKACAEERTSVRTELGLHNRPLVLFVGEISERKNVRLLVEAFAQVVAAVPEARLVLVGSPGLGSPAVAAAIGRLGISRAVTQLGHAQQSVVEGLVAAADVLVLPSLDEGFGFPALEAMSVGTAVVASDSGSLPEVVGDAGLIVPVNDAEALAHEIIRVLAQPELRAELGRRGRLRAATYSWRAAAEKTIQVYGNAIG
jgi:glycosyltransferase involved in cell wall biosynthesis